MGVEAVVLERLESPGKGEESPGFQNQSDPNTPSNLISMVLHHPLHSKETFLMRERERERERERDRDKR
jgi:hypothetical protein